MRRVYAGTIAIESSILVSQLIVYRFAASYLGREGFSEFALARRAIGLLQPLVLLGLGIAIPRYMAVAVGRGSRSSANAQFAAGLLALSVSVTVSLLLIILLRGPLAFLLFGEIRFAYLVPAMSLMLLGLALHTACYSYFRGNLNMTRANLLQAVNLGLLPILAFPIYGKSVSSLFTAIGAGTCLTSLAALIATRVEIPAGKDLVKDTAELVSYGLARVPADLGQIALMTSPAIFVAHLQGLRLAGLVALGTSVLTMIASLLVAIGAVLLPEASRMIGCGDLPSLIKRVSQILRLTVVFVLLITVVVELFAGELLSLYLGNAFLDGTSTIRIVILAALPYSVYVGLRTVVDAVSKKSINSKNTLIALTVFLAGVGTIYLGWVHPSYILLCFVFGLYTLGALTFLEVSKLRGINSTATALPELMAETFAQSEK